MESVRLFFWVQIRPKQPSPGSWHAALGLDTSKAPKHEKALFIQLTGEEARRLVADTHREALDTLARGRSTTAGAGDAAPRLRPGMQVSVIHGFNAQAERRYDAARFRTNDGEFRYPKAARRWYTATVVAHDADYAFHIVLERGDSGTDKDRREQLVFHPAEYVLPSSGTKAWMSWCVG